MTEKRKPSYDLAAIKRTCSDPKTLPATGTAFRTAFAIGYTPDDMVRVIEQLTYRNFVKSMTTYDNHKLWQDVYSATDNGVALYIKFQSDVLTAFIVVSFKERGE